MASISSSMINLGTVAPSFELMDYNFGGLVSLFDKKGEKGTLIFFICNHCPFVKHINSELVNIANNFQQQGIQFIAINSNDIQNYPDDSPEKMKEISIQEHYPFVYLFDATQEVAKKYNAVCTPDFYLFDSKLELVYRGQIDDSRPGNKIPVSGNDLRAAMKNLIDQKPISENQKPSLGCSIKWKNK